MKKFLVVFGAVLFLLSSCSSGPQVRRIDADTQTDLSGYWNDTDARIVCQALINDCLNSPMVNEAIAARGGRLPVVLVDRFRNETNEHIDTAIISSVMEAAIFNSRKLDFIVRIHLRCSSVYQGRGAVRTE